MACIISTGTTDPLEPYYFEPQNELINGCIVTPITDECVEVPPKIVDRFFTRYYYIKPGSEQAPYQVLFHSNRSCLICLAPEHPALKSGIQSLNFDIGQTDRAKNKVRGKGKKGAMLLQADSTLALLTDNNGKVYKIPSCVFSKLVEVHTELAEDPKRIENAEEGEGYFAILLPRIDKLESIKARLMTQEQYDEYKRAQNVALLDLDNTLSSANDKNYDQDIIMKDSKIIVDENNGL